MLSIWTCLRFCLLVFESFTGIQEKLGIINNGAVYAVFDYNKQNPDELDLHMGQKFIVMKKGDEVEKEWWWAKCEDTEGYIPKNLLGVSQYFDTYSFLC